jgi:hypothetical protein
MCTAVHPPVTHEDRLPLGAKVFIEGKNRPLHVTDSFVEVSLQMQDAERTCLHVTNLLGEPTTIPIGRVVSAVEPIDTPKPVDVSGFSMQGFGLKVKGVYHADEITTGDWANHVPQGTSAEDLVVVTAEDLAEAEIALVNLQTGAVLWANPACHPRSIRRAVKIARLAAEIVVLDEAFNTPEGTPGVSPAGQIQQGMLVQIEEGVLYGRIGAVSGFTEDGHVLVTLRDNEGRDDSDPVKVAASALSHYTDDES